MKGKTEKINGVEIDAEVVESEHVLVSVRAVECLVVAMAKKSTDDKVDVMFFMPELTGYALVPVRLETGKKISFSKAGVTAYVKRVVKNHIDDMYKNAVKAYEKKQAEMNLSKIIKKVEISASASTVDTVLYPVGAKVDVFVQFQEDFYKKYLLGYKDLKFSGGLGAFGLNLSAHSEKIG